MSETRSHETSIEIAAPIEAVWEAVSTAEGITSWFAPAAEVVPGVGGHVFVSWGQGMEGTMAITEWDPPRRIQTVEERDKPRSDCVEIKEESPSTPVRITLDYLLEARGGTTLFRIVHAGFAASAGWDDEYDSTRQGWAGMVRKLRHPGKPARTIQFTPIGVRALNGLRQGDPYAIDVAGRRLSGTILGIEPYYVYATVAEYDDALMALRTDGGVPSATLTLYGFDEERAGEVQRQLSETT
jgi:uncharacterized protein YndB with AHSA1/START domain